MDRDLYAEVQRLLKPLRRALALIANQAVSIAAKDDAGIQTVQVKILAGEVDDDQLEHRQPGGLTHVPPKGSEGIFLALNGERDNGVVLCMTARKYRPKSLKAGETALYNAGDKQSTIKLLEDGSVVVTSGGSTASTLTMKPNGDVEVIPGGKFIIGKGTSAIPLATKVDARLDALEQFAMTHTHPHPMGPTSPATPPLTPGQPTGSQMSFTE